MSTTANNFKIYFEHNRCLYILKFVPFKTCLISEESENSWHRRLGHLSWQGLIKLGLPYPKKCTACIEGKVTRLPFHKLISKSSHIGQLVHSDVCVSVSLLTRNGEKYFQVIMDSYSHFTEVKLLKFTNEAKDYLISYVKESWD